MKLTVNSKEILKSVQLVGNLIKGSSPVPILDCILFNIQDGVLCLEADNTEVRSKYEMPVEFFGNYFTCIPYFLLVSMLKGFPDGPVDFEFSDKEVLLKAAGGKYKIPLENATDFPKNKVEEASAAISYNSLEFIESLKKALAFSSNDLSQWDSTILITIDENETRIVGGTSKAVFEEALPVGAAPAKISLSRSTAAYLVSSISAEEPMAVSYTDNKVFFSLENRQITSIKPSAVWPEYKALFDRMVNDKIYKVDKDALLPPLKRLANITDRDQTIIKLSFNDNTLALEYVNDFKQYNATENLQVDYTGDALETGFPANQLLNILSFTHGETTMELSQPIKPCLITQGNIRCLIAAMKPTTNVKA